METDEPGTPLSPTGPPSGRRARRRAEIRARLLAAGRAVFTQNGVADATIAQITQAADVGFGTFYLYFPSKEALYRAVVRDGFAELGAQLDALLQGAQSRQDPWRTTVAAGVSTFFHFAAEHRDLFLLMFAGQEQGGAGMGGETRAQVLAWAAAVVRAAALAECGDQRQADEDLIDILTVAVIATLRRTAFRWMRTHADAAADSALLPVEVVGRQVGQFIAAGLAAAICPEEGTGDPNVPGAEGTSGPNAG
jgi:AcrR family transcriptional regulator